MTCGNPEIARYAARNFACQDDRIWILKGNGRRMHSEKMERGRLARHVQRFGPRKSMNACGPVIGKPT
jgi:hypothetical protein